MKRSVLVALLLLSACSSSSAPPSNGGGGDDVGAPDASSRGPVVDGAALTPAPVDASSGAPDAARDSGGADTGGPCSAASCAALVGHVKRTSTKPQHGGVGSVYVAVFDGNPVTDASHATVIARTLLAQVDLSADGAEVAYRVDGVPPRAQAYQVIAFLDDGGAVSSASPQPAAGDLISLQLAGSIEGVPITLAAAGDVTLDLPLNAVMP
jgi:hypothetical protein